MGRGQDDQKIGVVFVFEQVFALRIGFWKDNGWLYLPRRDISIFAKFNLLLLYRLSLEQFLVNATLQLQGKTSGHKRRVVMVC